MHEAAPVIAAVLVMQVSCFPGFYRTRRGVKTTRAAVSR
jgi:hypothetical protein